MRISNSHVAPHILDIILSLQSSGYETYLVGGAVRDLLLGIEPKDYDISTSAHPEEIRKVFGRRRARIIGRRFRLVHLYHKREIVEISTFRKAPDEKCGPESKGENKHFIMRDNEYGSAEQDAWRRDFSVNSLFYDPAEEKVLDFTGQGLPDIHNKLVRILGDPDVRFHEDPVRMLRGLKLVGTYAFGIENNTREAIESYLHFLADCSHSRLSLEIEKILRKPYSHRILAVFREYGLLKYVLPYLDQLWDSEEGQYMLRLLGERNKRLVNGAYRDSISLALATCILPFVEKKFGGAAGELWEMGFGQEKLIRQVLKSVFIPLNFPKRVAHAAVDAVFLQPRFFGDRNPERLIRHPRYANARELVILQNNVLWKDSSIPEKWPARKPKNEDAPRKNNRRSGNRRRKHRGKNK